MPPPRKTVTRARELRRRLTLPEVHLWQVLRTRPAGLRFRRQHPVGPYVADFYCASAKLILEIDGIAHDLGSNPARDEARDAWLMDQGYAVLRVPAREVLRDVEAVVPYVVERCAGFPSTASRSPSPAYAGEELGRQE